MRSKTQTFAQITVVFIGVFYLAAGLALIFAPGWFYANIGDFPPFNRHYMGDVGAFLGPLGIGLIAAARNPAKHRAIVGVAALGTIVHLSNHLFDDVIVEHGSTIHWLSNTLPTLAFAALLTAVYWGVREENRPLDHTTI